MNRLSPIIALLSAAVLLAGCAAPPNLIARRNRQSLAIPIQKISLLTRRNSSPAEAALDRQLAAELQRQGFEVVADTASDYAIAASAEMNWSTVPGGPAEAMGQYYPTPPSPPPPSNFGYVARYEQPILTEPPRHRVEHIPTYGIRLKLYRTPDLKQGRFETIWDGYVDAGLQSKPELIPNMLRNLCAHLGQDFVGHQKITP